MNGVTFNITLPALGRGEMLIGRGRMANLLLGMFRDFPNGYLMGMFLGRYKAFPMLRRYTCPIAIFYAMGICVFYWALLGIY